MRLRSEREENQRGLPRSIQRWLSCVVICGLINLGNLGIPQSVAAQEPSGSKEARAPDATRSSPKGESGEQRHSSARQHSRKGGIILTVLGIGVAGGGAAILTRPDSSSCKDGRAYGESGRWYPCIVLPIFKNLDRDRKICGGITVGLGSLMAVVGLLKIRRPKAEGQARSNARRANQATSIGTTSR